MLLDNMLWSVLEVDNPHAETMDRISRRMAEDDRLSVAILPLGSGMTLAAKKR